MSEEFKAIIELVSNAGTGAVWVAMAYMAWKALLIVICWVGGIWVAKMVIAGIHKIVINTQQTADARSYSISILKQFRGMLNIGYSGRLSDSEAAEVQGQVIKLIEDARKNSSS